MFNENAGQKVPNDAKSPINFFSLFFSDELIKTIVTETNRYDDHIMIEGITNETISKESRLNKWTDVTPDEIKTFFGTILWIGLDRKPSMYRYWSSSQLYASPIRKCMSRNRFQAILAMIHLTNNQTADKTTNKLYKLGTVLDYLNDQFQKFYTPGETICIDESMISLYSNVKHI